MQPANERLQNMNKDAYQSVLRALFARNTSNAVKGGWGFMGGHAQLRARPGPGMAAPPPPLPLLPVPLPLHTPCMAMASMHARRHACARRTP